MIKNTNKLFLFFMLISVVLLINNGCKDLGVPDYKFIVTLGEGVSGSPAADTYSYKELETIDYEYVFTDDPERSPGVFMNDISSTLASSGTIIMYRDVEIFVGDVDIEGNWNLTLTEIVGPKTESNIVFSNNTLLEGTFTDGVEYEGTWVIINNTITMTYANRSDYKLVGSISPKYMGGSIYSGETNIGTWAMVK